MLEFLTRLLLVSVCLNVVLKVSGLHYIFIIHTTVLLAVNFINLR